MERLHMSSGYEGVLQHKGLKPELVGKLGKCGHMYHLLCLVAMYNNGNKVGKSWQAFFGLFVYLFHSAHIVLRAVAERANNTTNIQCYATKTIGQVVPEQESFGKMNNRSSPMSSLGLIYLYSHQRNFKRHNLNIFSTSFI